MTDPQDPNHWDLLVSELGATPPPQEEKKPQAEPDQEAPKPEAAIEGPAPDRQPPPPEPPPKPRRAPTDWSRVAEELGVEWREELAPPATPEAKLASPAESAEAPLAAPEIPPEAAPPVGAPTESVLESEETDIESMDVSPVSTLPDAESAAPAMGPAELDLEFTLADLAPTDTELESPDVRHEPAESPTDQDERKTGRKRRRRRRKPAQGTDEPPAEVAAGKTGLEPEETPAPGVEPDDSVRSDASVAAGEDSAGRSERRRRRRSPSRKKVAARKDDESAAAKSDREPAVVGEEPAGPQNVGDKSTELKPEDAKGPDGAVQKQKAEMPRGRAKASHRGIPTWEEAVGIVISANMGSRAKRSNSGSSSRSRGGRNPAGRDKSGKKAK